MPFAVTVENEERAKGLTEDQARKALKERAEHLHSIFEQAGADMDPKKVTIHEFKDGVDFATYTRNLNAELDWVGKRVTEFDQLDASRKNAERWTEYGKRFRADPGNYAPKGGEEQKQEMPVKSLGRLFVESEAYAAAKAKKQGMFELPGGGEAFGLKANFTTSAGWAPESMRTGIVIPDEQRPIDVLSHIPQLPTSQAAVKFMEETTFTNAAAERAEAGAYAESTLVLTERSKTVRSVGASLPVTDEQLEDEDEAEAYLNQRLGFMVRQRGDSQVLVGDGIAPNLEGTLNVAGIQTQALGADTVLDAMYKALDLVRVTGRAQPNIFFIHPTDFQPVRLLKTVDGIYIWGSPADAGPERVWGLPLVLTTAVTQNTGIVGDYARFSALYVRKGLEVSTGFVNDDFTKGLIHIRAGMRAAMVHYRPTAFCSITGI